MDSEPEIRRVYTTTTERDWYSPVEVKIVNGRVEKITGREDIPYYDGKQNVRALASIAKIYAPDKLKFPLRRVGAKGEGKFKRISWDEALGEIASVFKKYRDEGRAREVVFIANPPAHGIHVQPLYPPHTARPTTCIPPPLPATPTAKLPTC